MKYKAWGLLLGVTVGLMMIAGTPGHAESLLGLAPLRVLLSDTKTNEMISLTNRSEQARTYKISMLDQVMDGNGNTMTKDDFPYSAKRMLRFMPRQVTLKPGEHQSLRVMVMPPEGLAEGEYHTHLIFDEVPSKKPPKGEPEPGFRVQLENQYSVGIPLIYRHGKVNGAIALTGATLKAGVNNRPTFLVSLQRTGNGEGFGVIKIVEKGGDGHSLILPRKAYLYREVDKVSLMLPLSDKETATVQGLQNKKLQVMLEKEGAEPQLLDVTH
jgi:P pilus assembly chaperone PapD